MALASGDDHAEWRLHPDCVEMGDAILLLGRQGRNTSKYDQQRYAAPYASQTHSHSLMKASTSRTRARTSIHGAASSNDGYRALNSHNPIMFLRPTACRSEERRVGKECVSTCKSR